MSASTVSHSAARPPPPSQLPGEREEQITSRAGLKLRLREWGPVDGEPLVLLHGLRGYSGTWRALASALQGHWRLIAFDQRGRGDSDWDVDRHYYTDAYMADLEDVLATRNIHRFSLLGHSMGGTTAYVYAAEFPDRLKALIIEDIAPGSSVAGEGAERIKREMATLPIDFADWAEARAYWHRVRPTVGDAAVDQRLAESLREGANGRIVWRYDAAGISATRLNPDPARVVDLWPHVRKITTPTLIIRGGRSDFCPLETVQRMQRENPLLTHATVAGASHYVHDDAPETFRGLVEGFLLGARPPPVRAT
jgi:pimeloyl-ACP methyl ester carboxylesterase